MGLIEFNKLPVNTLVGADWNTFKRITAGREIGQGYKGKYIKIIRKLEHLCCLIYSLLQRSYAQPHRPQALADRLKQNVFGSGAAVYLAYSGIRQSLRQHMAIPKGAWARHEA